MFLLSSTIPAWADAARTDLGALLADHLHCERKAVENALQLVRRYSDRRAMVDALARLAHEETAHLVRMSALLEERGLPMRHDVGNRYAQLLRAEVRPGEPWRLLDSLLTSAFIEARSHERLLLLGRTFAAAGDHDAAGIYTALASAEERHFELFLELAREVAPAEADARAAELGAREAEIIASLPHGPRIH